MLEAAHRGEIDFFYSLGGNLLETMPDRGYMSDALSRVRLRIHQDIVLNSSSLLPGATVLLLPAQTRYETPGGEPSTSTERRIRFSPEIPAPRIAAARPEWEIPVRVAVAASCRPSRRASPGGARPRSGARWSRRCRSTPGSKRSSARDSGCSGAASASTSDGFTRMPGGRARFSPVPLPAVEIPPGAFYLTTRRGKAVQ